MRRLAVVLVSLSLIGCGQPDVTSIDATSDASLADSLFALERSLQGDDAEAFREAIALLREVAGDGPEGDARFRISVDGLTPDAVVGKGVSELRKRQAARRAALDNAERTMSDVAAAYAAGVEHLKSTQAEARQMIASFDADTERLRSQAATFRAEYDATVASARRDGNNEAVEQATSIWEAFNTDFGADMEAIEAGRARVSDALLESEQAVTAQQGKLRELRSIRDTIASDISDASARDAAAYPSLIRRAFPKPKRP